MKQSIPCWQNPLTNQTILNSKRSAGFLPFTALLSTMPGELISFYELLNIKQQMGHNNMPYGRLNL
jgi:hypothetical protein